MTKNAHRKTSAAYWNAWYRLHEALNAGQKSGWVWDYYLPELSKLAKRLNKSGKVMDRESKMPYPENFVPDLSEKVKYIATSYMSF